jgi:hypothetical protein
VIPALNLLAAKLGVNAALVALVALVFVGLLTGFVLLAQSVVGWFKDRNP